MQVTTLEWVVIAVIAITLLLIQDTVRHFRTKENLWNRILILVLCLTLAAVLFAEWWKLRPRP